MKKQKDKKGTKDTRKKLEDAQKEFNNKLEGREAVNALAKAFDEDGLLNDEERETKNLQARVRKLEHEMEFVRKLLGQAINLDKENKTILKG